MGRVWGFQVGGRRRRMWMWMSRTGLSIQSPTCGLRDGWVPVFGDALGVKRVSEVTRSGATRDTTSSASQGVARALLAKGTDQGIISRFLFYYLKCRVAGTSADDKKAMLEATIAVMASLDRSLVSCKGLFGVLHISSPLKLATSWHDSLVAMIGGKLDHATLDNLLVPALAGMTSSLYNVTLVLRFLDAFRHAGCAPKWPQR
ncbi:hypothetical protein E2562_028126 [Oryza meyeriana var. granulata]|uniref:NPH3 domain-containing protein n=1 Tax=Oryza meyeriana var. granulata TaxID=110450 RepID=A0A6G1C9H2_9ORYZ|nr:hypothetical protein E2562_028126 [Oryza meyeriana var. granulata]